MGRYLPESLIGPRLFEIEAWQWLGLALFIALAIGLGALLAQLALRLTGRVAKRTQTTWDDALLDAVKRPAGYLAAGRLAVPACPRSPSGGLSDRPDFTLASRL